MSLLPCVTKKPQIGELRVQRRAAAGRKLDAAFGRNVELLVAVTAHTGTVALHLGYSRRERKNSSSALFSEKNIPWQKRQGLPCVEVIPGPRHLFVNERLNVEYFLNISKHMRCKEINQGSPSQDLRWRLSSRSLYTVLHQREKGRVGVGDSILVVTS